MKLLDIEKRLGSVVCQAFDDCNSCEAIFKVSHLAFILIVHVKKLIHCGQRIQVTALNLSWQENYSLSYLTQLMGKFFLMYH